MGEWWSGMLMFEKVFWYIAIPFTALFFIQLVFTFTGMGGEDADGGMEGAAGGEDFDIDGDGDGDGDIGEAGGFHIFTVKNFITFFTVFGWSGITLHNAGANEYLVLLGSLLIASAVMLLVALLFVSITLQGALREIDAVTAGEALPRGAAVRVVEVGGNGVLLVEKA